MKKIILAAVLGIMLTAATIPQFFYYNQTRRAIAIRDDQSGSVVIRTTTGQTVMTAEYPANRSWWISISRLAPGFYTATAPGGAIITFYKRP
jgi:hypothetical protein